MILCTNSNPGTPPPRPNESCCMGRSVGGVEGEPGVAGGRGWGDAKQKV
jgi:hypothetical protein